MRGWGGEAKRGLPLPCPVDEEKEKTMFKPFTVTLNRVRDRVKISEGAETLELYVDDDPMRLTAGITESVKLLKALGDESTDEDVQTTALYMARTIFGADQAKRLMDYYHQDGRCVISVCSVYIEKRLSRLIIKAQKKQ